MPRSRDQHSTAPSDMKRYLKMFDDVEGEAQRSEPKRNRHAPNVPRSADDVKTWESTRRTPRGTSKRHLEDLHRSLSESENTIIELRRRQAALDLEIATMRATIARHNSRREGRYSDLNPAETPRSQNKRDADSRGRERKVDQASRARRVRSRTGVSPGAWSDGPRR